MPSGIALMKPTAYLINTARGPVVDQQALTRALQERRIAGAGLDVFETGAARADDPILQLDNVILAPHALCWTDQCFAGNGAADVSAVLDVQHGRVPRGIVNRDRLATEQLAKDRLEHYRKSFGRLTSGVRTRQEGGKQTNETADFMLAGRRPPWRRWASAAAGRSAQSAADRAVEAAKQYAGTEITIVWEAGLQALDPLNFSGPKWKELTGINVKVIEVPTAEMFTKILQEHRAGTGAYDALNVIPSWMPDLARAGALEPLDAYVDKYGYREELQEIAPVYRDNQMTVDGTIYGFPDDGDVFVLYYRTDILEDPAIQAAFKEKYGYDLPVPPTTWKEFDEVGSLHHRDTGGKPYGAGFFRDAPYAQFMFQERFRNEGGKFFDAGDHEGDGQRSRAGVEGVHRTWLAENKCMPPGVETWGFVENLAGVPGRRYRHDHLLAALRPLGRGLRHRRGGALLGAEDRRSRARSATPCTPGGHPQLAAGFALSLSASSKNKEAAYLFIQWLNSRGDQPRSACSCPTRCAIRSATAISRARSTRAAGPRRRNISTPCRPAR